MSYQKCIKMMEVRKGILKKLSTAIICFTMLAATFSIIDISYMMPTANAATVRGTFGFSYLKGNSVDGLYNGKVYALKKGESVQLRVKSLSGATKSDKVTLQLRRRETSGALIVISSHNIYQTGVYKCGKISKTNNHYYLYAEGGAGTGLIDKWVRGSGNVECY